MGLVFYPDSRPGITRRRCGKGFSYLAPDGTSIDDKGERKRLASMAVPPAYEDVWMTPRTNGHLWATGLDAAGRKQYRYHPEWTETRAQAKFNSLADFGRALPEIRSIVARDLRKDPGRKDFALAAAVLLIDEVAIRVGNAAYAAERGTAGATTLKRGNLRVTTGGLSLRWTAKGGKRVQRTVRSKRLMRILQTARDLPGAELFTWVDDDGDVHKITSSHLNDYLAEAGNGEFTAKTFRTWAGSLAAFEAHLADPDAKITDLARAASDRLANTPTVARQSYIHPRVLDLASTGTRIKRSRARTGLSVPETMMLRHIAQGVP